MQVNLQLEIFLKLRVYCTTFATNQKRDFNNLFFIFLIKIVKEAEERTKLKEKVLQKLE